jgi:hypothetical protein
MCLEVPPWAVGQMFGAATAVPREWRGMPTPREAPQASRVPRPGPELGPRGVAVRWPRPRFASAVSTWLSEVTGALPRRRALADGAGQREVPG